jgi:prevent-host-death family protein
VKSVTTHQAKSQLSKLLAEVEAGAEIVICRGSRPAARLVPLSRRPRRRRPRVGETTSLPIRVTPDAFAPMGADELAQWGL